MAIGTKRNFPGPYQVRIFYTVTINTVPIQHKLQLNCNLQSDPAPGALFSSINVIGSTGGLSPLNTEVDAIVALMQPIYNSGNTVIDYAELWKFDLNSDNANFVSSYAIGLPGTSGSGVTVAGEAIWSFRTTEGGILKVFMEESTVVAGPSLSYAAMSVLHQNIADYFAGAAAAAFWLGRDTSYPFNFRKFHPGQNEAVWKRRYRPGN